MTTKATTWDMVNGSITSVDRVQTVQDIPWVQHPRFQGVLMRHLVTGAETGGMLSCHMVRMNPDAVLAEHVHEGQWELHEVVEGEGRFFLGACETAYSPGCLGIIPKGTVHKVVAGKNGMVLLAKFFPALM